MGGGRGRGTSGRGRARLRCRRRRPGRASAGWAGLLALAAAAPALAQEGPVPAGCAASGAFAPADAPLRALRAVAAVPPRAGGPFACPEAVRPPQASAGSRVWEGAAAGAVVGAGLAWVVLHRGGSTALCDRSANQDAMSAGECAALVAAGALVGAGLGALVGSRIGRGGGRDAPGRLRLDVAPGSRPGLGARLVF